MVNMMTTERVKERLLAIRDLVPGGHFTLDNDAGTAVAMDGDGNVVFRAIQKGRGGPWITRHVNSPNVTWHHSETT